MCKFGRVDELLRFFAGRKPDPAAESRRLEQVGEIPVEFFVYTACKCRNSRKAGSCLERNGRNELKLMVIFGPCKDADVRCRNLVVNSAAAVISITVRTVSAAGSIFFICFVIIFPLLFQLRMEYHNGSFFIGTIIQHFRQKINLMME